MPDQDHVVARAFVVVRPHRAVGEYLEESRDLAFHRRDVAFVKRHPLRDDAALIEMGFDHLEIFLRIKSGASLDEGMDRIGRDDVEFFRRRGHEMARVVVDDLGALVVHDAIVLLREIFRGRGWDQGLELADYDALDGGIGGEGSRRHARAEADDEHRSRIGIYQRRQMPQHALQLHVVALGRSLDLARDMELDRAVVPLRDRDGGVAAFGRHQDLRLARNGGDAPAVSDELARYLMHAPGQESQKAYHDPCAELERLGVFLLHQRQENAQAAQCGDAKQRALRIAGADPRDEHEAHRERAQNRAQGVRGVDAADGLPGIARRLGGRGEREGEARAPAERRGQEREDRAHEIELEGEDGRDGQLRIDRPIGQPVGDDHRRPADAGRSQYLAPGEAGSRIEIARERGADGRAERKPAQENRQDDREGVDGGAERQAQEPRPDDFRAERSHARKRDGEVDGPDGGCRRRHPAPATLR